MGIFSKLKKAMNPGGAIMGAVAGNGKNYIGPLDYAMDKNKTPPPTPAAPFDPGQRVGSQINGQSGVAQPSMNLGWTNGGYQYHNSPFNQTSQPPPPMSFGGGQPATPGVGGASGIGAGGMGGSMQPGPPLQGPQPGASMPSAGAQPPMPTGGSFRIPEQAALIAGLRGR